MMRAWYEGVALRNAPVWAVCIETLQQHGIMGSWRLRSRRAWQSHFTR